jgi:hypothetical protein
MLSQFGIKVLSRGVDPVHTNRNICIVDVLLVQVLDDYEDASIGWFCRGVLEQ